MIMAVVMSTSLNAGPAIAFGDLLDLARFHKEIFPNEICDVCQTINLGSRRFCKGCTGRLPAYYATSDATSGAVAALQQPVSRARLQARRPPLASACLGALVLVVAAAAGLPMIASAPSSDALAHGDTLTPLPAVELTEQAASTVVVQAEPNRAAIQTSPEPNANALYDEDDSEAAPDRWSKKGGAIRRTVRPQHVLSATSARVARCEEMNFLSRAVCMNRECAQPSAVHMSSCAQAIRQRRLDEARRNPTQVG